MFTFLCILGAMLILVAFMFKPLANTLLFSGILAIVFRPLYNKFLRRFRSESAAAGLTVLIVLVGIFLFLWIFGQLVVNELGDLYGRFKAGEFVLNREEVISQLPTYLQEPVLTVTQDLNSVLSRFTAGAFQTFSALISNIASFLFSAFIVFFALFFLLKDGSKLKKLALLVSPISNNQENVLLEKVVRSVNGVMKGTFLVAIIQAIIATIGFLVFGLPNPFLWAICTFLAAFVPNIGTAVVLIPAILYLFLTGHPGAGIGLAIWGAVAVGLIDNILSPKLVGRSAKLHPLLVLLSVIGGLEVFGVLGFLLGPIFMAIFAALVEMYTTDFKEYLQS